jgi:hypothetical protein
MMLKSSVEQEEGACGPETVVLLREAVSRDYATGSAGSSKSKKRAGSAMSKAAKIFP